eukprot:gene6266-6907_t
MTRNSFLPGRFELDETKDSLEEVDAVMSDPDSSNSSDSDEEIFKDPIPPPTSPTAPPVKRQRRKDGDHAGGRAKLTLDQKCEIILEADSAGDQVNQNALARKYGVSGAAIHNILKKREIYLTARLQSGKGDSRRIAKLHPLMEVLENELEDFISQCKGEGGGSEVVPTMRIICAKAEEIAARLGLKQGTLRTRKPSLSNGGGGGSGEEGEDIPKPWTANSGWYTRFCRRRAAAGQADVVPVNEEVDDEEAAAAEKFKDAEALASIAVMDKVKKEEQEVDEEGEEEK